MQLTLYFDQTRCTGCDTCVVACKDWNDVPAGPASWMRVIEIEEGKYPNPFLAFLVRPCYHCANPPCVAACPAGAIAKHKENGIVTVDRNSCLGKDNCDLCLQACPYRSPQFGAEDNARMQKCDFCMERWAEGKKPICVEGCPMRALDAGPAEEMAKYRNGKDAYAFVRSKEAAPSVVFKSKPRN